jgi:hypothetical protein
MITTNNINNSRPVLLLYSAGTGGEFIASLLQEVSDEFNPLGTTVYNKDRNRTHINCVLDYSVLWKDPDNPKTWVPHYVDKHMIGSKRYLLKDHPNVLSKYYNKYLPNVTVLHLITNDNYDYYARVTFAKLQNKVLPSEVNHEFIFKNLTHTVDEHMAAIVYNWASKYDWVWQHELQTIVQLYLSNRKHQIKDISHIDSIQMYVDDQLLTIKKECEIMSDTLALTFKNYNAIDVTNIYSSRKMWKQVKEVINITDIEKAIRRTDAWHKRNRKLLA